MSPDQKEGWKENDEWKENLRSLRETKGPDGDKWLQILYKSYHQQFLSDNNRIWTTGQWMISISLAALAVLPTLANPLSSFNILLLAIPSVSLIWVWLVIAENHRGFQEKSQEWLSEIERILGVKKPGGPKARGRLIAPGAVRRMRWCLAFGISGVWVFLILYTISAKICWS